MKKIIIALVGNPNSGKTTIFNEITALNQHVGNLPGVTVEIVSGKIIGNPDCNAVDLPGLYSLNTLSREESITKEFLLNEKPNVLINVVDCTKLKRNLFLTLQLKELNIPTVIALNMIDKYEKNNEKLNIKELEKRIGMPIVPITNANKSEIKELINQALQLVDTHTKNKKIQDNEKYKIIEEITVHTTQLQKNKKTYLIDKILTNRILGIPIFILIMFSIFHITFDIIGPYFTDLINKGIEVVSSVIIEKLEKNNVNPIINTFISQGIFKGITSILSFLPIIVILYFFLSLLEDSGYMTRIAFIMDTPLRKIGLSGRSIIPILLGFGCSVPAILSLRTINTEKERKLTLALIPFISCSAKIPIYTILVMIFFKEYAPIAMTIIYFIGIIIGILAITIIKNKKTNKQDEFFIMELPDYKIPTLKNTWRLMWNKSKDFLNKTFSTIFIATIVIWFLKSFNFNLNYTEEENSILAYIAKKISPFFIPIGIKDWRIVTSLIVGITAKEAVISTLTIFSSENIYSYVNTLFTTTSAISFIIFVLLYTPCVATISAIKKEFGVKDAIKTVIKQLLVAYIASYIVYSITKIMVAF